VVGVVLGIIYRFRVVLLATLALAGVDGAHQLSAENLTGAFAAAYSSNPTLRAERARLRATDELVPQALSGWRPTITAQASAAQEWHGNNVQKRYSNDPKTLSITLSQPIFRGFKTVESTKVAQANIKAGRAQLLSVEQNVLFNAVQAYLNVARDRQILSLRQTNVQFLKKQLQASQARFSAGELTRTDVAQSRASLSGAQASVAVAVANVKASEANYETVIGRKPGKLAAAHMAKGPKSLDSALATAQENNPNILAAAFVEEAATHQVEVVKGDLLPSISITGTASVSDDPSVGIERSDFETVQGVLTIPLYEGGRVYSSVRQAKQIASQNRIQVIGAVRAVRENVYNAWNNLAASRESLASVGAQLSASKLALDGVKQEYLVGSRTTIDVLNAQQALLNVQVTQLSAKHDQLLASYQLLAAIGHLTSDYLGLGDLYDPTEHYDDVRGKWIGLSADTVE
jgi:outer membrane protein